MGNRVCHRNLASLRMVHNVRCFYLGKVYRTQRGYVLGTRRFFHCVRNFSLLTQHDFRGYYVWNFPIPTRIVLLIVFGVAVRWARDGGTNGKFVSRLGLVVGVISVAIQMIPG
jgi:hypothetical protein